MILCCAKGLFKPVPEQISRPEKNLGDFEVPLITSCLRRFIHPICLSVALVLPSAAQAASVAAGAKLFAANCAVCHRADGSGGIHFSSAISADLRAPRLEQTYHNSDQLLLRAILQARDEDGDQLDQPMPAWQGRLTKTQAKDIIAFLKTLKGA